MQQILRELTTYIIRPAIKIDGTAYELRHPDELSLTEEARLRQWGEQIDRTFKADADLESMSLAEHQLRDVVSLLMPTLSAEVAERLSDMQRLAILQGFTRLASQGVLVASVQNGGSSSPGSSASTVVPQETGSDSPPDSSSGSPT